MKKGLIVGLVILVAAAGGAEGWYYYNYKDWKIWNLDIDEALDRIGGRKEAETVYVTSVGTLMGVSTGAQNRYAGVVEAQDTVEIKIESGRRVSEVKVKVGEEVKEGQLLFEYDLSSIQENMQQAQLDMERLKNEALSLTDQIATLERDKAKAKADAQLSYTVEIETNRMNLKKNEYDQKKKQAEIDKLEGASVNTEVRSDINGIIQKIDTSKMNSGSDDSVMDSLEDDSYGYGSDSSSNAFITILSTGAYRVKGKVNELNINNIIQGYPVLIRSRVDENQTWTGTMGNIDRENASSNSGNSYWGMMDSSDTQTSSSTYPFYVDLDSSEGLMLGQHVYIEMTEDIPLEREGVWLSEFFIVDADKDAPYVFAATSGNRLEKRYLSLGDYDSEMLEYKITDGLSYDDRIAFPTSKLTEGMVTVNGTGEQTLAAWFEGDEDFTEEYTEGDVTYIDETGESSGSVDFIDEEYTTEDNSSEIVVYDEDGNIIEDWNDEEAWWEEEEDAQDLVDGSVIEEFSDAEGEEKTTLSGGDELDESSAEDFDGSAVWEDLSPIDDGGES